MKASLSNGPWRPVCQPSGKAAVSAGTKEAGVVADDSQSGGRGGGGRGCRAGGGGAFDDTDDDGDGLSPRTTPARVVAVILLPRLPASTSVPQSDSGWAGLAPHGVRG